jgi:hypothetical protein
MAAIFGDIQPRTLLLGAVGVGALYYLMRKNGSRERPEQQIQRHHKRALLMGHATAKGHRGATRYVTQSRHIRSLPNATGRSYRVTRAVAEREYQRNMRPAGFFVAA